MPAHQPAQSDAQISGYHAERTRSAPAAFNVAQEFFACAPPQYFSAKRQARNTPRSTAAAHWRSQQYDSSRRQAHAVANLEQRQDHQTAQAMAHQVQRVRAQPQQILREGSRIGSG